MFWGKNNAPACFPDSLYVYIWLWLWHTQCDSIYRLPHNICIYVYLSVWFSHMLSTHIREEQRLSAVYYRRWWSFCTLNCLIMIVVLVSLTFEFESIPILWLHWQRIKGYIIIKLMLPLPQPLLPTNHEIVQRIDATQQKKHRDNVCVCVRAISNRKQTPRMPSQWNDSKIVSG